MISRELSIGNFLNVTKMYFIYILSISLNFVRKLHVNVSDLSNSEQSTLQFLSIYMFKKIS